MTDTKTLLLLALVWAVAAYLIVPRLWAMMRMGFSPDINALVALILIGSTLLALLAIRFFRLPAQP